MAKTGLQPFKQRQKPLLACCLRYLQHAGCWKSSMTIERTQKLSFKSCWSVLLGASHLTFEGRGVWVFKKTIFCRLISSKKKTVAKKYQPLNGFVCQRKTLCHQRFRAKKISPTPPSKVKWSAALYFCWLEYIGDKCPCLRTLRLYKMYRCTLDTEALRIIRDVSDCFIFWASFGRSLIRLLYVVYTVVPGMLR